LKIKLSVSVFEGIYSLRIKFSSILFIFVNRLFVFFLIKIDVSFVMNFFVFLKSSLVNKALPKSNLILEIFLFLEKYIFLFSNKKDPVAKVTALVKLRFP